MAQNRRQTPAPGGRRDRQGAAITVWSATPVGRVVRLDGLTAEQLAVALDPLPADAPVVVRYRPVAAGSAAQAVGDVLDTLERIVQQLFPSWLPGGAELDRSDLDRRAVRILARRQAAIGSHSAPFLADLAESALAGHRVGPGYPPEVRAVELVRLLSTAYRRSAVALLVDGGPADPAVEKHHAEALRWLCDHAPLRVWLTAGTLAGVDRFPTVLLSVPEHVRVLGRVASATAANPATDFPAPAGRPHPASAAERSLEAALARCSWAHGRSWNQTHQSHPLSRPIRVDLIWPAARCVVELDGPDHRGRLKYADDRRRDNALVQEGFAVLRFTNEELADDLSRVLGIIEQVLTSRRDTT